jgi:hypothetical protein
LKLLFWFSGKTAEGRCFRGALGKKPGFGTGLPVFGIKNREFLVMSAGK